MKAKELQLKFIKTELSNSPKLNKAHSGLLDKLKYPVQYSNKEPEFNAYKKSPTSDYSHFPGGGT